MTESFRELLNTAEFVVDTEGRRKTVLLDYPVWKKPLEQIEDMEDSAEIDASRRSGERTVSWEEARTELRAKGIDV